MSGLVDHAVGKFLTSEFQLSTFSQKLQAPPTTSRKQRRRSLSLLFLCVTGGLHVSLTTVRTCDSYVYAREHASPSSKQGAPQVTLRPCPPPMSTSPHIHQRSILAETISRLPRMGLHRPACSLPSLFFCCFLFVDHLDPNHPLAYPPASGNA